MRQQQILKKKASSFWRRMCLWKLCFHEYEESFFQKLNRQLEENKKFFQDDVRLSRCYLKCFKFQQSCIWSTDLSIDHNTEKIRQSKRDTHAALILRRILLKFILHERFRAFNLSFLNRRIKKEWWKWDSVFKLVSFWYSRNWWLTDDLTNSSNCHLNWQSTYLHHSNIAFSFLCSYFAQISSQ